MVARCSNDVIGSRNDESERGRRIEKRREDPLDATTPFQRWVH